MAKGWVKRWFPTRPGEKGSLLPILEVTPPSSIEKMHWRLPPSKSHAIRYVVLAAQSSQEVLLHNMTHAGQDVVSMRRCLSQMGVAFVDIDEHGERLEQPHNGDDQPASGTASWSVKGVGPGGLKAPISVLHAGNSGTSLRILMALASLQSTPIMLDGDASLRRRSYPSMLSSLRQFGVRVSHGIEQEGLPILVQGPAHVDRPLVLDVTHSSQPTTAWYLAAPSLPSSVPLRFDGQAVSRRHASLTKALCQTTGGATSEDVLEPWLPQFEGEEQTVPSDCSMMAFAFLMIRAKQVMVHLHDVPLPEDGLGHEVLLEIAGTVGIKVDGLVLKPTDTAKHVEVDLRDANDLITPLAAMLALGEGGRISGAPHAAFKETNRLTGTVALLKQFGLTAIQTDDGGLTVEGGQRLQTPTAVVETLDDHRMQMTALVLATACDDKVRIEGPTLHEVADPDAVERLRAAGVRIEESLHQPW